MGVWLVELPSRGRWNGCVWDGAQQSVPEEWQRFSPELALGERWARGGNSFEQSLNDSAGNPVVGPLLGMKRAVWAPIEGDGDREGILMAAWRAGPQALPRAEAESVAADLALALGYQRLEFAAREQARDLAFARQILSEGRGAVNGPEQLRRIVSAGAEQAGVGFICVGHVQNSGKALPAWCGPSPEWAAHLDSGPLAELWRRALITGQMTGCEHPAALPAEGFVRWAALPVRRAGNVLGVLVAGLRPQGCTLATLEGLELRAALAADFLAEWTTEEQKAQYGLEERERVEASPAALVLLDESNAIAAASPSARQLLAAAATGTAIPSFTGLLRNTHAASSWLAAARSGSDTRLFEAELLAGKRIRARTLFQGHGSGGLLLEVTAVETPAGPLRPSERELRALVDWMEQGVVIFGAQRRIAAINRRFSELTGLPYEDVRALASLDELLERFSAVAENPEEAAQHWRELVEHEQGAVREEVRLAKPVARVLERAGRPIQDDSGARTGWLEIYRDVQAGRMFQTRWLQTEKLAGIGQMVSGIAHELSSPLTSILGYTHLLRRGKDGAREEVEMIHREAERAHRMLRQLLESGRETAPQRKAVSVNHLVQRAMELRALGKASHRICVEVDLDPAAPLVEGDEDQILQVVTNLIANAEQAMEASGSFAGTIRVSTRLSEGGGVRLEVADDGPGIPPALMQRIFEPFFTTKPAGVGTGLGLAIVMEIARAHGGQVHAANRSEGGAVFTVELPGTKKAFGSPLMARPAKDPAPASARPALPAVKGRALVVEDEPTVARLIADVL
ncbi:MAG TPA: ATP-binding protein, partial [Methylomirabilota bacterium]|nr:ATP-binding protein [Methylomirabilota bacterium]